MSALDEAVANVSAALERSGLAPTTLVLFTTDNGAPYKHLGGLTMSNFPLRGGKAEVWEGGVRGACFLHGAVLPAAAKGQRTNALVSAADWFPTLIALAGASAYVDSELARALYGVDMSALLVEPRPASRYKLRSELLINADHLTGRAALRSGDLKLVKGELPSGWVRSVFALARETRRRERPRSAGGMHTRHPKPRPITSFTTSRATLRSIMILQLILGTRQTLTG